MEDEKTGRKRFCPVFYRGEGFREKEMPAERRNQAGISFFRRDRRRKKYKSVSKISVCTRKEALPMNGRDDPNEGRRFLWTAAPCGYLSVSGMASSVFDF